MHSVKRKYNLHKFPLKTHDFLQKVLLKSFKCNKSSFVNTGFSSYKATVRKKG